MQRIDNERLEAMLRAAHAKMLAEDCTRRLDNRALRLRLDHEEKCNIIRCWGGDQV